MLARTMVYQHAGRPESTSEEEVPYTSAALCTKTAQALCDAASAPMPARAHRVAHSAQAARRISVLLVAPEGITADIELGSGALNRVSLKDGPASTSLRRVLTSRCARGRELS